MSTTRREFIRRASGILLLTSFGLRSWLRKVYAPTQSLGLVEGEWLFDGSCEFSVRTQDNRVLSWDLYPVRVRRQDDGATALYWDDLVCNVDEPTIIAGPATVSVHMPALDHTFRRSVALPGRLAVPVGSKTHSISWQGRPGAILS